MENKHYLFWGRLISTFGDSLYGVAIMWYIYHVTKDAFITGVASSMLVAPMVLSVFMGPIIDHFNRKKLMLYSQLLQMVLMLLITLFLYLNLMSIPLLILGCFVVGMLEIFEGNAEHAMSPMIMDENELVKFNSWIQTGILIVSSLSKAICIFIVLTYGIESIFLINFITFVFASILFFKIKYSHKDNGEFNKQVYKQSIKEGLEYFKKYKLIWIAFPTMIANFTGAMSNAILPAFTDLKGGPLAYGYYLTVSIIFAAIASFITPKLSKMDLNQKLTFAPIFTAIFLISTAYFDNFVVSIIFYGLSSVPIVIMNISMGTYIQTEVANNILSRVGTIMGAICTLVMPVGALIGGWLAKTYSPVIPFYITAVGFMILGVIFLYRIKSGNKIIEISKTI